MGFVNNGLTGMHEVDLGRLDGDKHGQKVDFSHLDAVQLQRGGGSLANL